MKKLFLAAFLVSCSTVLFAQEPPAKKQKKLYNLSDRTGDHFMIQYGVFSWLQKPDSINTGGFSRSFNMHIMFDFPFKTNPQFSVALGVGLGTDNLFFKQTNVDIINNTNIKFNRDTITNYKKFKLATGYLEVPVELRFTSDPENYGSSLKFALGIKVGTMINAHTKAKIASDADGNRDYTVKYKSRKFFNSTRIALTARVGYGFFNMFASYQITQLIKDGAGPVDVRPFTVGIALSGL